MAALAYAANRPTEPERQVRPPAATLRRRRAVALVLAAAVVWAVVVFVGGFAAGTLSGRDSPAGAADGRAIAIGGQSIGMATHVVVRGDTLWSIARSLRPRGDIRELVDKLAAGRNGRPLHVGESIPLPGARLDPADGQ